MQIEITGKVASPDYGYNRVEFSIFNEEQVSLLDSMSLALASYLDEYQEASGLMWLLANYINTTAFDEIEIGKTFDDGEA